MGVMQNKIDIQLLKYGGYEPKPHVESLVERLTSAVAEKGTVTGSNDTAWKGFAENNKWQIPSSDAFLQFNFNEKHKIKKVVFETESSPTDISYTMDVRLIDDTTTKVTENKPAKQGHYEVEFDNVECDKVMLHLMPPVGTGYVYLKNIYIYGI